MDAFLFWIMATVAVTASVLVVGQRHPMYSVMLLIVSFAALAGLYVLLDAPFVAAIQIIIYVGAIMVLFLFVVMLMNVPTEELSPGDRLRLLTAGPRRFGAALAVMLVVQLFWTLQRSTSLQNTATPAGVTPASVPDIGRRIFTEYSFAFEATSVLILVAMVGAIVLARKEPQ
jgi:NADH-quinone oxidoreductase subunit J